MSRTKYRYTVSIATRKWNPEDEIYDENPEAMKLRWMNQLQEIGVHGKASLILVPSDMPQADFGGVLGAHAYHQSAKDGEAEGDNE